MPKKKANEDFAHTIIKVFKTERIDEQNRFDLRIVRWKTAKCNTLEKRRIWEAKNTELFRKMVGLSADDVQFVVNNSEEILKLLKE